MLLKALLHEFGNITNSIYTIFSAGQDAKDDSSSDTDEDIEIDGKSQQAEEDGDDSHLLEEENNQTEVNFDEEANIAKKVLQNFISPTSIGPTTSTNDFSGLPKQGKDVETILPPDEPLGASTANKTPHDNLDKSKEINAGQSEGADDLQGTVFISNLPFDVDNKEVKQRFSAFGEVEYFAPVLDRVTKYELYGVFTLCCLTAPSKLILHVAGDQRVLVFSNLKQQRLLKLLFPLPMLWMVWVSF